MSVHELALALMREEGMEATEALNLARRIVKAVAASREPAAA